MSKADLARFERTSKGHRDVEEYGFGMDEPDFNEKIDEMLDELLP